MLKATFLIFLSFVIFSFNLLAADISSARLKQQVLLDQACEKDRFKKLAPRRREIYQECITVFKKSEDICKKDAAAYNGRRINGAPLFYELPSCVKAFEYREATKKDK